MEILSAVLAGAFIFLVMTILLNPEKATIMARRLKKYETEAGFDEIQQGVLIEKKKNKRINTVGLVSKEFANYLAMSGIRLRAAEFIGMWLLSATVPTLLAYLISGKLLTMIAFAAIGIAAPPLLVQRSRKKRQEAFNKQFGESLVIMRNSIKAGFSFQQAMESIAVEMQPPLSTEFEKTVREIHYGIGMEEALRHMSERVKNKDLDLLITAVLIAAQVGANLSEIMDVISETIRDRVRIKQEVRVLTTSGRFSGAIIGLLPVFVILLLMVINPDYFGPFAASTIGKIMIGVCVVMEIIGFTVIRKIANIKY
ncbi:MAG: type II secretion protein F [Clostridiales bacterium]|jgi:tight adherence protein B|nr:type II secretion protein F [Clostridiales bacterium]